MRRYILGGGGVGIMHIFLHTTCASVQNMVVIIDSFFFLLLSLLLLVVVVVVRGY